MAEPAATDASPRAAWAADSGKPKVEPIGEQAQTTVEVSLKGVPKALGVVPVAAKASLTDLRAAITEHIDVRLMPPRFAFVSQTGQSVRGTREAIGRRTCRCAST